MLRFARWVDKLSDSTGKVLSVSVVILTVILVYEVVMRYLVDAPTQWAHESSGLLFVVWFTFGGSYALRHKAHVNIDLLYNRLSPRGRAIVNIVTATLLLLICWMFIWYGSMSAWKSLMCLEHTNTVWSPPIYPVKILIVVAMLMFALQVLAELIRDVHTAVSGREIA